MLRESGNLEGAEFYFKDSRHPIPRISQELLEEIETTYGKDHVGLRRAQLRRWPGTDLELPEPAGSWEPQGRMWPLAHPGDLAERQQGGRGKRCLLRVRSDANSVKEAESGCLATYSSEESFSEALQRHRECLQRRQRVLGDTHEDHVHLSLIQTAVWKTLRL